MKREDNNKLKKLFDDVKDISDRLEKMRIAGVEKDIVEFGGSSHILMGKKDKGKKAFVIILPEFDKIE